MILRRLLISLIPLKADIITCRYVRNVSRRGLGPKLLDGEVKTLTIHEEEEDDFWDIKDPNKATQFELEEALSEDLYTDVTNIDNIHEKYVEREKDKERAGKKTLIKRKYFKYEQETNLLTYSAKEQIRYLHEMDSSTWNPKKISESFPISENGAKKLLKNNSVLTCPERIKQHDAKVTQRWDILKTGRWSPLISDITQQLYRKGELIQTNYSGNSTLPKKMENKIISDDKVKQKVVGEHLSIVKKYLDSKESRVAALTNQQNSTMTPKDSTVDSKNHSFDDDEKYLVTSAIGLKYKRQDKNKKPLNKILGKDRTFGVDMPHSEFKENIQEELFKNKYKSSDQVKYQKWIEKQDEISKKATPNKPYDTKNLFSKISKYEKDTVEAKIDKNRKGSVVYMYDEKLGYQYPKGKVTRGNIKIPPRMQGKQTEYRVGNCIYDEDGHLLYKLPS